MSQNTQAFVIAALFVCMVYLLFLHGALPFAVPTLQPASV